MVRSLDGPPFHGQDLPRQARSGDIDSDGSLLVLAAQIAHRSTHLIRPDHENFFQTSCCQRYVITVADDTQARVLAQRGIPAPPIRGNHWRARTRLRSAAAHAQGRDLPPTSDWSRPYSNSQLPKAVSSFLALIASFLIPQKGKILLSSLIIIFI